MTLTLTDHERHRMTIRGVSRRDADALMQILRPYVNVSVAYEHQAELRRLIEDAVSRFADGRTT